MQKIKISQISFFLAIVFTAIALSFVGTRFLLGNFDLGDFRAMVFVALWLTSFYLCVMVFYRIFLEIFPLEEGEIIDGSKQEFVAQVNTLFYIVLFYSLTRTNFLPIPLGRMVYLALGAHMGRDSYSGGAILDPPLTHIGDNCIIGHDSVLYAHAIEGTRFSLAAIHIGNRVTIGAHVVIMSGVTIGDGAIVSAGAVVLKGTRIQAGETWGGVPAKRLKSSVEQ